MGTPIRVPDEVYDVAMREAESQDVPLGEVVKQWMDVADRYDDEFSTIERSFVGVGKLSDSKGGGTHMTVPRDVCESRFGVVDSSIRVGYLASDEEDKVVVTPVENLSLVDD